MFLVNALKNIKNIVSKNRLFISLLIAAGFLRLYRLGKFATFLSDQGRDAIIIKRILAFEHFPAIGAPSSLGQVYLGPFYYYLIAPFLAIFRLQPVGLVFGVASISIVGIIISYLIIKTVINKPTALYFVVLLTFSFININFARFSWNPNLLPLFAFLTLFFFYKALAGQNLLESFLFGAFLSFSIQLHYLAIFLVLPIALITLDFILSNSNESRLNLLKKILTSLVAFIFFSSPLLIFDLRHNFLNSKNFLKLYTENKIVSSESLFNRIIFSTQAFLKYILNLTLPSYVTGIIFILFVIGFIYILKKKANNLFLKIHLLNIFSFIFAFSFLNSFRHPHYFGQIYYSLFFVAAYFLSNQQKKLLFKYFLIPIFLILYLFFNAKNYYFILQEGGSQIEYSKEVADFLEKQIGGKPFNIATWPVDFTEDNFLYFLELKGLVPADRKKIEITDQLFVLCSKEPCQILDSPSWNISMFGKAKIDKIWKVRDLNIYKLVHEK